MQYKIIAMVIFVMSVMGVTAQDYSRGKIAVTISNHQKQVLENATVELLKTTDSSLVKTAISDKNGLAEIDNVRPGTYRVRISFVNYVTQYSQSFPVNADQRLLALPGIMLQPAVAQMAEVVVTARKPFIQRLNDRLIVNVESSIISAGSSALDVLERSPGVTIDPNDVVG